MTGAKQITAKLTGLKQTLRSQTVLVINAGALAAGTIVNSALGFAYWWVAARWFAPETIGLTAAAVSIMSLIGLFGQLGLGTLLIGQSQVHREQAPALISASLAVSLTVSLVLGAGFIAVAKALSLELGAITGTAAGAACFIIGCGVTGFSLVLDNGFVGMLRSSLQSYRNGAFSLLKLGLLLVVLGAARSLGGPADGAEASRLELWIFATWVTGQLATAAVFAFVLARLDSGGLPLPRLLALRPRWRSVLSHHLLDLVTQAPAVVMPFLVAVALSPAVNAAFNAEWLMLRMTFLVPAALTVVLFAAGNSDSRAFAARLRFSLAVCAAAGVATTLGFLFLSKFILGVFNPAYPEIAGASLEVMGVTLLAVSVNCHYLTIQRLRHRMLTASGFFACGGLLELIFAFLGARLDGLSGLTLGWTIAVFLQTTIVLPVVLAAAGLRWPAMLMVDHPWRQRRVQG